MNICDFESSSLNNIKWHKPGIIKAKIVQNTEPIKDIKELKLGTRITTVPVKVTMPKRIPRGSHQLS